MRRVLTVSCGVSGSFTRRVRGYRRFHAKTVSCGASGSFTQRVRGYRRFHAACFDGFMWRVWRFHAACQRLPAVHAACFDVFAWRVWQFHATCLTPVQNCTQTHATVGSHNFSPEVLHLGSLKTCPSQKPIWRKTKAATRMNKSHGEGIQRKSCRKFD